MRFKDVLAVSFSNLRGNILRTILTILGVAIGIGAIVFLYSLGRGVQRLTVERIAKSATLTTIDVSIGKSSVLKLNDDAIKSLVRIPNVRVVSSTVNLPGQVSLEQSSTDVVVVGAEPSYADLKGATLVGGDFLKAKATTEQPVAITTGALKLFDIKSPRDTLGKKVKLTIFLGDGGETSDIKKVEREYVIQGIVDDAQVITYIPLDDAKALGVDNYSETKVQVDVAEHIESVKNAITNLGYTTRSVTDLIDQIHKIFNVVQIVLAGFGVIALVVASIGMFNTLTIALLERTREIGIMKAIGARSKDVRRLFLTEAIIIGTVGGATGIFMAMVLGFIINSTFNGLAHKFGGGAVSLFYYDPKFLLGVMLFSVVVGLTTGFYPARRAAKLNPLNALRYE